ncbi:MAG: ApaLI family restriction endonuclease [Acidobacteria bacterium]|nr:ApaLI family restriction endonuclease [Acidobacteriota bacterium]
MTNEISIKESIRRLADKYANELERKIALRIDEMKKDDLSHYLIYQVLGISDEEGALIDSYQNKGRFLYNYAGKFLEYAALLCIKEKFPDARRTQVENTLGQKPKQFEIDCLIGKDAVEIKWRDATTDGDHITKEHTRIKAIKANGFKPIRLMFFYPNREQSRRIQETLKTLYAGVGGEYFAGDEAWNYLRKRTKIDLKAILLEIAEGNKNQGKQ